MYFGYGHSDMLDNKMKVWREKRVEYCYASM